MKWHDEGDEVRQDREKEKESVCVCVNKRVSE